MKNENKIKIYFKGDSGIKDPVDMDGLQIKEGDYLTFDYGDFPKYNMEIREDHPTKPFFEVKINERGGYFAESIKPYDSTLGEKYFFLHDFRFKYCKRIEKC